MRSRRDHLTLCKCYTQTDPFFHACFVSAGASFAVLNTVRVFPYHLACASTGSLWQMHLLVQRDELLALVVIFSLICYFHLHLSKGQKLTGEFTVSMDL